MAPCEWVIDIIKDWVIAQAYATEAWVTEWFTPYSITGHLDPNATCLYFKKGTYNGKAYYRRSDSAFFIWWQRAPPGWVISIALGAVGVGHWFRNNVNIVGIYTENGTATGSATVTEGHKSLCTSFINRGDPAAADYTQANLTADNAWHELDLSGIVPENAKAVSLHFRWTTGFSSTHALFRKHGNVNAEAVAEVVSQVSAIPICGDLTVGVDDDRKIDYNIAFWFTPVISLTVKGWWL